MAAWKFFREKFDASWLIPGATENIPGATESLIMFGVAVNR